VAEDDRWIVVFDPQERCIRLWDLETSQLLTVPEARALGYVLAPVHRCAVFGKRTVAVWDESGVLRSTFDLPAGNMLWEWRATSDGRYLVAALTGGRSPVDYERFDVWELPSGRAIVSIAQRDLGRWPRARLPSCAVTPDGRQLVTGSAGYGIRVWDLQTGAPVGCIPRKAVPAA
jgi:WD40 repeat protein